MGIKDRSQKRLTPFYLKNFERIKTSHDICFTVCSPVRFKIIKELFECRKNGLTVSDLAKRFEFSLSRTSHQLTILKKYNVATVEQLGREKVYRITKRSIEKNLPCWRLHK